MRKWLWMLFFPLAQAAGEAPAGEQHGVTLSNRGVHVI
jgi:hypothetical protein